MTIHIMTKTYEAMLTKELVALRRGKINRISELEARMKRGDKKEILKLKAHVAAINNELASRVAMMNIFA